MHQIIKLKKRTDSIVVNYDDTKADKAGENCHNKNLYANPQDPVVCVFLALGIYCAMEQKSLEETNTLFLPRNADLGNEAKRFCSKLSSVIQKYADIVESYIRFDRENTHGIRKGGSRHACVGTTCPPSLVSLALRGEWSMGKVFDIYFKFGEFGDQYLGKILCVLDPNDTSFACLPPISQIR